VKLNLSPKLSLPPSVVTSTVVAYGGKGMGKTNLGAVLVEEMTACRLQEFPDAVNRDTLAAIAKQSPTSSGYRNNLGALRSLGLLDYVTGGAVVALPVLFPGRG
jgi:hypothetical protein